MEKEEEILEDRTEDDDDDLLNFDLDDLTPLEIDQESQETDEDVIELVDLVEEGEGAKDRRDDDITDFFDEEFGTDEIIEYVAGFSSFLSFSLMNRFFFEAEYLSAVESFEEDINFEPKAWNIEVAFIPIEDFEVAVRYGGSEGTLNFLPDRQVGICGIYEIFNSTSIWIEYLNEEFENDDEVVTITGQLAVKF